MILHDLHIAGKHGLQHIHVEHEKIKLVTGDRNAIDQVNNELIIELGGATALPGLINSHDHLDFNLFPQLGNRIYENYTQWGKDIHRTNAEQIAVIVKIPLALRIQWGVYKNLLNGFTTVVNHGEKLTVPGNLVNVIQEYHFLHSPSFEKHWRWKLNQPFKNKRPYVMHLGEGTDSFASKEIGQVIAANYFHKKIIAVHGVAMNKQQAASFAGLVWCPASNYFMLEQTARVNELATETSVVFGTDSTLTAPWNAWEHFRMAIKSGFADADQLTAMLTSLPAALWKLKNAGKLDAAMTADIIVLPRQDAMFDNNPKDILLVIRNGQIQLIDESIAQQVRNLSVNDFSPVQFGTNRKFVRGNFGQLVEAIQKYYPAIEYPFA
jgi:cytosine/adenosine deaminase-related metal-dependent hydrolase